MPSFDDITKAVQDTSKLMSNFDVLNYTEDDLATMSKQADVLSDLNSSFPVVQSFLQLRGLTHINQLDKQGQADLFAFLEDILRSIQESK